MEITVMPWSFSRCMCCSKSSGEMLSVPPAVPSTRW